MIDLTIEGLKIRKRALEIDVALAQGAVDEISHIIGEMERRRGGRPRKGDKADLTIIPQRVGGGSAETETDEQGALPSIDDVRGILKTEESAA